MSNKKRRTPMSVPRIRGPQQQQPFDISDVVPRQCELCGGVVFDQAVRLGVISSMSPKNRTEQDILVEFEVYLCRDCGHEYGQKVPVDIGMVKNGHYKNT